MKSPVLVSVMGSGECIVLADTSDGEKALVSYDKNQEVYDVTYVIGFEQERIRAKQSIRENPSGDTGNALSYKDFVPIPVKRNDASAILWITTSVCLLVLITVCLLIRYRIKKASEVSP